MDKKLLVSLMIAAPVSAFAAQWIPSGTGIGYSILPQADDNNWSAAGILASKPEAVNGVLTCPVSAVKLTHNVTLQQLGKYNLNASNVANAVLRVNGKYLAAIKDGKYIDKDGKAINVGSDGYIAKEDLPKLTGLYYNLNDIDLSTNGSIDIQVIPTTADQSFTVGTVTLSLQFNFSNPVDAWNNSIVALKQINNSNNRRAEANRLRNQYTYTLNPEYQDLKEQIGEVETAIKNNDASKLAELYASIGLNLWKTKDATDSLSVAIDQYNETAEAYNSDVDKENAGYANYVTNSANLTTLQNNVLALKQALNTKTAEIENAALAGGDSNAAKYAKAATQTDIDAASKAIDAYEQEINEAYADLDATVSNFAALNAEKENIETEKINSINFQTAVNDWTAYGIFLNSLKPVTALNGELQAKISAVNTTVVIDGVDVNVYEKAVGEAFTELADAYTAPYSIKQSGGQVIDNPNIKGASQYYTKDAAGNVTSTSTSTVIDGEIKTHEDNMNAAYTKLQNIKAKQDEQWSKAQEEIAKLEEQLEDIKAIQGLSAYDELDQADRDNIDQDAKDIAAAIEALKNAAKGDYVDNDLDVSDQNSAYGKALAKVNTEISEYQAHTKLIGGVIELLGDFVSMRNAVSVQTNKTNYKGYSYGSQLYSKFQTSFDAIDSAIEKYYADSKADVDGTNKATLDGVKVSIQANMETIEGVSKTLATDFCAVIDQIVNAKDELTKYNNLVSKSGWVISINEDFVPANFVIDSRNAESPLTASGIATALNNYETSLNEIAAGTEEKYQSPQNAINAAESLSSDIDTDKYYQVLKGTLTTAPYNVSAQVRFAQAASQSNYNAILAESGEIDSLKADFEDSNSTYYHATGWDKVGTPDLPDEEDGYEGPQSVGDVPSAITSAGKDTTKLLALCQDLEILGNAYNTVYDKVQDVKDNKDAYDRLVADANYVADTYSANSIKRLGTVTVSPALEYYTDLIKADSKSVKSLLNNTIKPAYENASLPLKEEATEADYSDQIRSYYTNMGQIVTNATNNQKAYDQQVAKSQEVAVLANEDIIFIKENVVVPGYQKELLDSINEVLKKLGNTNIAITNDFANGKSATSEVDYEELCNGYIVELNSIMAGEAANYKTEVQKANDAFLALHYLGMSNSGNLNTDYLNAVQYINAYTYDIDNETYKALLTDPTTKNGQIFNKNHEELFACNSLISKLWEDLTKFKGTLTVGDNRDDFVVLEVVCDPNDPDFNANNDYYKKYDALYQRASKINDTITTTKANMDNAASAEAKSLYATLTNHINKIYGADVQGSAYYELVNTCGMTVNQKVNGKDVTGQVETQLASQLNTIAENQKSYNSYFSNGTLIANKVHNFILAMNKIANSYDNILPAADVTDASYVANLVQAAVVAQWNTNKSNAETTIGNYITEMDNYKNADEWQTNVNTLNTYRSNVGTLNTEFGKLTAENKVNNYKKYNGSTTAVTVNRVDIKGLEGLLDDAKTIVTTAKSQQETFDKNNTIKQELITNADSYYNNTEKAIKALYDYSGYRDDQTTTIDGFASTLASLKSTIETATNSKTTEAQKAAYISQFNTLNTDIANAYQTVFNQEKVYAQSLYPTVQSAFNNAKLNNMSEADVAKYDKQINDLKKAIDGYTWTSATSKTVMDNLKADEDTLCGLINTLEQLAKSGTVDTDTYKTTVDSLGSKYDKVEDALNALLSTINTQATAANSKYKNYGSELAGPYETKINTYLTTLSTIKGEYQAIENSDNKAEIIADADKYDYLMDNVQKDCDALETAWNAAYPAELAKAVSDNRYDDLYGEVTGYWTNVEFAHNQITTVEANDKLTYNISLGNDNNYNSIENAINGYDTKVGNTTTHTKGLKELLDDALAAHSLTATSTLASVSSTFGTNLKSNVNKYVRKALDEVAYAWKNVINNTVKDDKDIINFNDKDENGVINYYLDAENIVKNLDAEQNKANNVDQSGILNKKVGNTTVATNDAEAKTAYEGVKTQLDNILASIGTIMDNAKKDNLVVKGNIDGSDDGEITANDVQTLIFKVLKNETFNGKDLSIADGNNDGKVNMADITWLISYYLGIQNGDNAQTTAMRLGKFIGQVQGNNSYVLGEITGENGLRRFAVNLANDVTFVGGQLDIILPAGMKVANVSLGDRASDLNVWMSDNGDATRVLMTALDNTPIEGNNGCVLYIDVEGNGDIELQDVIFSDINANAYVIEGVNTGSGVGIMDAVKDGVKAIYNAAGQKLNKLTKGVNIVRNADGTVTKKIGK